jgi:hypothetical protein
VNAPALIDHLRDLRIDLSVTRAGKLHVEAQPGTITDEVHALLVVHRDELITALSVVPARVRKPLDWPPAEPAWFAAWMRDDDARRGRMMAAGKRRTAELRLALIDRRLGPASINNFAAPRQAAATPGRPEHHG